MANKRNNVDEKRKNNERAAKGMKKLREQEDYLRTSVARDRERKRKLAETEEYKEHDRMRKQRKRSYSHTRNDESYTRQRQRQEKPYSQRELLIRQKRKYGANLSECISKFFNAISKSASYVCTCCQQLWFEHSVRPISSLEKMSLDKTFLEKCTTNVVSVDDDEWICNTCVNNLKKLRIPKMSVKNGMHLPERPKELELTNLEERLISLRIPFMQIRSLSSGGQFSLRGSVVNVPAQIEPTIRALPRAMDASETIPVKLKRMKSFQHAVLTENVRPAAVLAALKVLLNTSDLYKEANISIDTDWDMGENVENISCDGDISDKSDDDSDTFSEVDETDRVPVMTLLEEPIVDKNTVVSVAPGEGQKPLSIFKDPDAEYLAFPTLFCGERRPDNQKRYVNAHYSDICKWELRHVDRRIALHIPNIFYKMKRLQTEQVCQKVNLAVRRCKTKSKNYTAGYILKITWERVLLNWMRDIKYLEPFAIHLNIGRIRKRKCLP